jgi:hypothetical protein
MADVAERAVPALHDCQRRRDLKYQHATGSLVRGTVDRKWFAPCS